MSRVDQRIAVLAETSALLGEINGMQALGRMTRLGLPHLGDLCTIDLTLDDGSLSRAASVHVLGEKEPLVAALAPPERLAAMASRRAAGVTGAGPAILDRLAVSADQREQLARLGPRAWLCVPLLGPSSVLGIVTFAVTGDAVFFEDRSNVFGEVDLLDCFKRFALRPIGRWLMADG